MTDDKKPDAGLTVPEQNLISRLIDDRIDILTQMGEEEAVAKWTALRAKLVRYPWGAVNAAAGEQAVEQEKRDAAIAAGYASQGGLFDGVGESK